MGKGTGSPPGKREERQVDYRKRGKEENVMVVNFTTAKNPKAGGSG